MKKLLSSISILIFVAIGLSSTQPIEKEAAATTIIRYGVIYSNLCCDLDGNSRCFINWSPVGSGCWCNGIYGVGNVCPY